MIFRFCLVILSASQVTSDLASVAQTYPKLERLLP